jgi:tripartite-type tricarboxylate transporter receptor subunit TctC
MGDTPTLFELMDQFNSPEVMRRVTRIVLASGEFGRPMVAGPGAPPERIKLLRDAYTKAMRDPGLIEEAKKGQMDMEHTPGEDLQALMKDLMNQPRDVVERVKKVLTD